MILYDTMLLDVRDRNSFSERKINSSIKHSKFIVYYFLAKDSENAHKKYFYSMKCWKVCIFVNYKTYFKTNHTTK